MQAAVSPVAESDRFDAMDLLRGCAVLGILVMNIGSFAMPFPAYFNPTALGDPSAADFAVWSTTHLLADQKFMTMFSLLFGAGVLLMTSRVEQRGAPAAGLHYRRMTWLLLFGLLHAYVLWYGDILVLYAICGMLVYPARRRPVRTLVAFGLGMIAIGSAISLAIGLSMSFWPPEEVRALSDELWRPPPDRIAREVAAFQGGWLAQAPMRAEYAFAFHSFEMWLFGLWRVVGLMLAGMALLKLDVLTGGRPPAFYAKLAAAGFALGLPLVAVGLVQNVATGWTLRSFFLGSQWNYFGSLLVALGWIGLILRVRASGAARGLVRRLAAVGRMAFTCYIAETLVGTTLFYGHGLGLFGTLDRPRQMIVVLAIWIALLVFAPLWLARYRDGPLEWLWRTLTYGRPQPMVRAPEVMPGARV
jgi:uncharacterized protein